MKKMMLCLLALMTVCTVNAQRLIPMRGYGTTWDRDMISSKNKPNGYFYRLRVDVQCTDLPKVAGTENLELFIAEPTDFGWLTLYRLPMADDNYEFVVVLYADDKQPIETINLCDITNNRYCEVQDVRWDADNHCVLFNMACPSYSSMINGKGSKLYSYGVDQKRIVWETDYLVSNDIFILNDKYVFCGYGFTDERDYLFMLDKKTGKMYSKIPMMQAVQYMEFQQKNGREVLFTVDYGDRLNEFAINDKPASGKKTAKKKNNGKRK